MDATRCKQLAGRIDLLLVKSQRPFARSFALLFLMNPSSNLRHHSRRVSALR